MKTGIGRTEYFILMDVRHVKPSTLTGSDLTLLILAMSREAIDHFIFPVFF